MTRPPVEVADILRVQGDCFREENRSWLGYQQLSVLRAISACRTAALGGHLDSCSRCDLQAISYNSCRNRHCPPMNIDAIGARARIEQVTLTYGCGNWAKNRLSGRVNGGINALP